MSAQTDMTIARRTSSVRTLTTALSVTASRATRAVMSTYMCVCLSAAAATRVGVSLIKLECGPVPNVMAALPNIGGALCSTPQSLADAQY